MPDDYQPTIELSAKQIPAIKNWRVGGKYKLTIEVEQVGVNTGWDGNEPLQGRFKIVSASSDGKEYGYTDPSKKKSISRKDIVGRLGERATESVEYDDDED